MIDDRPIKLFIYGNMSTGRPCHRQFLESGARFENSAGVKGYQLYSLFGGLPAALPDENAEIIGELYSCTSAALRHADDNMLGTNFQRICVVSVKLPRLLKPFEFMTALRNEDVAWIHVFRNPKPMSAKPLVSLAELDRDNPLVN
jgi:gamma-glutamylcyclotransferase (GGCT)/AIG2-like uncharacterized protein YtfP